MKSGKARTADNNEGDVLIRRMREIKRASLLEAKLTATNNKSEQEQIRRRHRTTDDRNAVAPKTRNDWLKQLRRERKKYRSVRDELAKLAQSDGKRRAEVARKRYADHLADLIEVAGPLNLKDAPKFPAEFITINELILGIDSLIRAVANSLTADTAQEPSMLLSEAIDKTDLRILCELNKYKHTLKLFDLASAQDLPSPKILSKRLGRLVKLRLAIRRGERSGWTLTAKGRDAIAKTTH